MAVNPDGSFSGPDDLQLMSESGLSGRGKSYGNGIGDFDGDGDLDYIMAVGSSGGHVYIFPKTEPGNNFDLPIRVASFSEGAGTIRAYERKNLSFFRKYLMKQIMGFYSKGGSKYSKYSRH